MLVGITSGATTVWNPFSGTSSWTGCCSGGFSCFGWSTNTSAVSTLTELSVWPAFKVAYTAAAITTVCAIKETAFRPNVRLRFLVRLDSIKWSNTSCRPPARAVSLYEIAANTVRPLVQRALQYDDNRASLRRRCSSSQPAPASSRRPPQREIDRQADEDAHGAAPHPPGPESGFPHIGEGRGVESPVGALDNRNRPLGPTQGIDDDLENHATADAGGSEQLGIHGRRAGEQRG